MATVARIGVLNDMADLGSAPDDLTDWLEREVAAMRASGRISAPVEFVHAYGLGLPSGTAEAIERAFHELVAQDVVLIVGPSIGDNALIATPLAERLRVPTINVAGAARARGKYMFQLQNGSHEDQALIIARHLAEQGARRLGVVHDISPVGTRLLACLEEEAGLLGAEIVARYGISPVADSAARGVAAVLDAEPDAFVHLGLGASAPPVAQALGQSGWQGPRMMNTAGSQAADADFAATCDGWTYIDVHSDTNRTLQSLCAALEVPPEGKPAAARGHDLGRIVAEGIARARDLSREGVRLGLEHVKWLPAAQGDEGTLLGFGNHDHAALHGRYLVVRQWRDGRSIEVSGS